jgi:hypothetical protein
MPIPQSLEQCCTLLGCVMAVYIAARLAIKALYRMTIWAISRGSEE